MFSRSHHTLIVLLATFSMASTVAHLFADEPTKPAPTRPAAGPDTSQNRIFLLEQATKTFRIVDKIDLPNRVYLKKTAMDGVYKPFLTDGRGKLGPPEQILLPGSTVRGDWLGGSRERYYVLTVEGYWRRSLPPATWYVQNDNSSRAEYVMYSEADREDVPYIKARLAYFGKLKELDRLYNNVRSAEYERDRSNAFKDLETVFSRQIDSFIREGWEAGAKMLATELASYRSSARVPERK